MSDILDDYREWKSRREERIGTHSDRCHLWRGHEACMIHRLAAALQSARLTDAEREAVRVAADAYAANDGDPECESIAEMLRGLLERTLTTHTKPAEGSVQDSDT